MDKLHTMLDRHLATLTEREPYFAPNFQAARVLLDGAIAGNGGLIWPHAVCGPLGCSCGNRACLHRICWRIYCGR
jgi:hypothetical protein